jgi:purine-binding chemotaxis protein CheW
LSSWCATNNKKGNGMNTDNTPSASSSQRARIDWHEVKRRLEEARVATGHVTAPDAETTKRILETRALALGRKPSSDERIDAQLEVVEFVLAEEHYAVESRQVRDVYPLEQLTPVPCTPAFVRGIVNLHGEIVSVIDLKRFFDLPDKGLTDLNKIIVLESVSMCFGILADLIVGVHFVPVADIQASLPTLTGIREDYLKGVTPARLVILDAEALLADPNIVVHEQIAA